MAKKKMEKTGKCKALYYSSKRKKERKVSIMSTLILYQQELTNCLTVPRSLVDYVKNCCKKAVQQIIDTGEADLQLTIQASFGLSHSIEAEYMFRSFLVLFRWF